MTALSHRADLEVSRRALAVMEAASDRAHPKEACGLLLGHGRSILQAVPTRNVHPQPESRFEVDPQALIDAHRAARGDGPQVLGYFHSHPSGEPVPSAIDAAMSAADGSVWAILGEGQLRFWRDLDGGFRPLSYVLVQA
ncbi:M67 family metallopeptidase [Erythrobacter sp.]|uniref:M67 family metallopeptidase n=1 Tax=Erythrobacter sp. TaxID=1042 RepID=UPI002EC96FF7|nr:M67 family metallopeptidase [Erythrobacter sp.]